MRAHPAMKMVAQVGQVISADVLFVYTQTKQQVHRGLFNIYKKTDETRRREFSGRWMRSEIRSAVNFTSPQYWVTGNLKGQDPGTPESRNLESVQG